MFHVNAIEWASDKKDQSAVYHGNAIEWASDKKDQNLF